MVLPSISRQSAPVLRAPERPPVSEAVGSDSLELGRWSPPARPGRPFVDPLQGVAASTLSPLGEIFHQPPNQIRQQLIESQPLLHADGLRHRHFQEALQLCGGKADNLDELVAAWTARGPLEPGELTTLMQEYGRQGSSARLLRLYDRTLEQCPQLGRYEVPRELCLEALVDLGQAQEAIGRGEALLVERAAQLPETAGLTARQLVQSDRARDLQIGFPVLNSMARAYRAEAQAVQAQAYPTLARADLLGTVQALAGWAPEAPGRARVELEQAAQAALLAEQPQQFLEAASRMCGRQLRGPVAAALLEKLRGLGQELPLERLRQSLEAARDYQAAAFRSDMQKPAGQRLLDDERALGRLDAAARLAPVVEACEPTFEPVSPQDPEAAQRQAVTQRIFQIGRQVDRETRSGFVAGSWRFVDRGGTVDMPVNRPAIHAYRHLNAQLGLDEKRSPQDVQTVCQTLHRFLDEQFELVDPKTGQRPMENLQSMVHHVRDRIAERRHDVCQSRILGSSQTSPHLELLFGKGDCRATSLNFALAFGLWKKDQERACLREAMDSARAGEDAAPALNRAQEWQSLDILMVDLTFVGNLRLETDGQGKPMKYRLLTDSNGRPLPSQSLLLDAKGQPQAIEDHSLPVLAHRARDGTVDRLTAVDPFYRELYQLGWLELKPAEVLDPERGFRLACMGVAASDGSSIPIWGKPTPYSGSPMKPAEGEYGQESFGGQAVAVGDPVPFLPKRSAFDDFAEATAGLVTATSKRRLLDAIAGPRLREAALGLRHRLYQEQLADLRSPGRPFMGWAPEKVVIDETSREALLARIPGAKQEAARLAPSGTVLYDPAFQALHASFEPALAVEAVGLSLYLDDLRNGEELGAVLSDMLRGRDATGLDMLLKTQRLAHLASHLDVPPAQSTPRSWHSQFEVHPEQGVDPARWNAACQRQSKDQSPDPVGDLTLAYYLSEFRGQEDPAAVREGLQSGQDEVGLRQLSVLAHLASATAGMDPGGSELTGPERRSRALAALEWLNGELAQA